MKGNDLVVCIQYRQIASGQPNDSGAGHDFAFFIMYARVFASTLKGYTWVSNTSLGRDYIPSGDWSFIVQILNNCIQIFFLNF